MSPDFTVFDYCIGFDYIDFGDRYFRMPFAFYFDNAKPWIPETLTYEKAKEMAEELLRKVTVAELAKEMEIEEEEIYEAIRLSANHMDYIEEGTNEGQ